MASRDPRSKPFTLLQSTRPSCPACLPQPPAPSPQPRSHSPSSQACSFHLIFHLADMPFPQPPGCVARPSSALSSNGSSWERPSLITFLESHCVSITHPIYRCQSVLQFQALTHVLICLCDYSHRIQAHGEGRDGLFAARSLARASNGVWHCHSPAEGPSVRQGLAESPDRDQQSRLPRPLLGAETDA